LREVSVFWSGELWSGVYILVLKFEEEFGYLAVEGFWTSWVCISGLGGIRTHDLRLRRPPSWSWLDYQPRSAVRK